MRYAISVRLCSLCTSNSFTLNFVSDKKFFNRSALNFRKRLLCQRVSSTNFLYLLFKTTERDASVCKNSNTTICKLLKFVCWWAAFNLKTLIFEHQQRRSIFISFCDQSFYLSFFSISLLVRKGIFVKKEVKRRGS